MTMARLALVNANRVAYVLTPPIPPNEIVGPALCSPQMWRASSEPPKTAAGFTDLARLRDAAAGMKTAVEEDRRDLELPPGVGDTTISKNGPMNVGLILAAAFAQQDLPASERVARDRLPRTPPRPCSGSGTWLAG